MFAQPFDPDRKRSRATRPIALPLAAAPASLLLATAECNPTGITNGYRRQSP